MFMHGFLATALFWASPVDGPYTLFKEQNRPRVLFQIDGTRGQLFQSLRMLGHEVGESDEMLVTAQIEKLLSVYPTIIELTRIEPPKGREMIWQHALNEAKIYAVTSALDEAYRNQYIESLQKLGAIVSHSIQVPSSSSQGGLPRDPTQTSGVPYDTPGDQHPYYPRPPDPRPFLAQSHPVFNPETGAYRPAWLVDGANQLLQKFPNLIAGDPSHWVSAVAVNYPWGGLIWDRVESVVGPLPESAAFNIRANLSQNFGIWMISSNNARGLPMSSLARLYTEGRCELATNITIPCYKAVRDLDFVYVVRPGAASSEEELKRRLEDEIRLNYQFPEFTLP